MESTLAARDVEETPGTRRRKRKPCDRKNQPLKVVYISNPMRVQASAAEFRGLVQELTGRDAEFPDPPKFPSVETNAQKKQEENDDEQVLDLAAMEDAGDDFLGGSYQSLEDIFMRDMMEKLAA